MNLPNKLTMMRILLVPVFMVLAAYHWMLAAGVVFALASITDFLDGAIARKYHLVTDFAIATRSRISCSQQRLLFT